MKITFKDSGSGFQIGTSYLLVIFFALCLMTFSVLSLSLSVRDYQYCQQIGENRQAYYLACQKAHEKIIVLEQEFLSSSFSQNTESFSVTMNERQALEVTVTFSKEPDKTNCSISRWAVVNTTEWNGDTTLPVLGSQ